MNKYNQNLLSLYVHWPYCESKCPYCDFNSHVNEKIEVNNSKVGINTHSTNKIVYQALQNNIINKFKNVNEGEEFIIDAYQLGVV